MKLTRIHVGSTTMVALVFLTAVASGPASTRHGPDLTVVSLSRPPAQVMARSAFVERFREANVGDRRASSSTTRFYLSPTRGIRRNAIRLLGGAHVRALRPGRLSRATAWLTVPAATPAHSYFLIACANDRHHVNGRNDCRVATRRIIVRAAGSPGGSRGPGNGAGPGGPGNATPMCVAIHHPTLSSTNSTCFDGDATNGIFVSVLGDNRNPGTIAAPKRTLSAGVSAAAAVVKDVYVTAGVYRERLTILNGVNVYGGYDTSWRRSPSNITKITGSSSIGADAYNITKPTVVQLVTIAPTAPINPDGSSYGVDGIGSSGLVLDHVTVHAAPGAAGSPGLDGANGANGSDADSFNGGGKSPIGHPGGSGGLGGYNGSSGADGAPGQSTVPDAFGRMGGPGGRGGERGSDPEPGAPGFAGDFGVSGLDGGGGGSSNATSGLGFWTSQSGAAGQSGSDGHGGGGGGGGGSDRCSVGDPPDGGYGGGGGGGGGGGAGGKGGFGGGGSFGIFLDNSVGAVVRDSTVTAADGGAGGVGGQGGYPGTGGLGAPGGAAIPAGSLCSAASADGGHGGNGGGGGLGGDGGGGAGGPSIAIYGLGPAATPGTTASHGLGGAGAPGHGQAGANGIAANYDH